MTYSPEFASLQRVVAGRYSLVREIGRGGMGIVFLARDVALDRLVAIKLLPPELARDTTFRERFLQEARMAASLAHPHIVPIHSVEAHDEVVFFVMAFVDGESLGERIRRRGPLGAAEASRIVQEVAWGLAHAHARGIVHRDVKPDNILIDRESGRAMVTDFGIARTVSSEPGAGAPAGTPHFLSPEQMRGEPGDARSDVFALGVTAWHALTGGYPFDAPNVTMLLVRQSTEPAPSLGTVMPGAHRRLVRAVDRCLARGAADRWGSAEELAVELNAIRARSGELPAPVRAWLRDIVPAGNDIGLGVGGMLASLSAWGLIAVLTQGSSGLAAALDNVFTMIAMSLASSLFAGLALIRLGSVVASSRALIEAGYGHEQARLALVQADADQASEKGHAVPAERRQRALLLGFGGAILSGLAIWGATLDAPDWLVLAATVLSVLGPMITVKAVLSEVLEGPSPWSRLMRGRFGRGLFRIARLFTGRRKGVPSAAQPTILALGLEAEALYRALPPAMRDQLHDLPEILAALRAKAEQLRVDDRDAVGAERISGVVAAMESIRLELMGMSAGVRSVPDVTRNLEEARRLAERMEMAARRRDITPSTPTPRLSGLDRTP